MLSKLICVMYVDHLYTMFHYLIYPQMLHVWNIYLHLPQTFPSFVGKYSSTMEHLGMFKH